MIEDGSEKRRPGMEMTAPRNRHARRLPEIPGLGPAADWSAPLCAIVRLALDIPQPCCVFWGADRIAIPNAAYDKALGGSGPLAGPPDTAAHPAVAPLVNRAFAGEAVEIDDLPLPGSGLDPAPERHFSMQLTPVRDEAGGIDGVWCLARETTGHVRERRRATLRLALTEALLAAATDIETVDAAAALLGAYLGADTVGIAEADPDGRLFRVERDWTSPDGRSVIGTHRIDAIGPELAAALGSGRVVHIPDIARDPQTAGRADVYAAHDCRAFAAAPMLLDGRLVGTTFALSRRPRRWHEDDVALLAEVGHRTWSAVMARRAETALRETQRQHGLALRAARAGTFLIDGIGRPPVVSDTAKALFGFGPEQTPTLDGFLDRVHEDDRDRVRAVTKAAIERGEGHYVEYKVALHDGAIRWLASRAEVEAHPSGRIVRGALIDITERRLAEHRSEWLTREAERANTLLNTLAETVDDLIYVKDREHRIRFANPASARAIGWSPDKMIGRREPDWAADPAQAASIMENDRRVMETGAQERFEETFTGPSGTRFYLSTKAPLRDPAGQVVGLVGVTTDITDRKRMEESLRRERELLRTIFDSIPVMLTLYDPEVNVLMLNRECETLTGWTTREAAAVDLMAEIYPDPDHRAEVQRFMTDGEGWMDIRMRTRDGGTLDTMWANVALSDDRRVGIGLDISDRKRAERHRQLLVAELDHRVKNTLAVIQAIARQSFRAEPATGPLIEAFLGRLRALAAAHDLLTQTSWDRAGLGEIAEASVRAAGARDDAVTLGGPDVLLSPRQTVSLAMAFHELTTNAARHGALSMPDGRVDIGWTISDGADGGRCMHLAWRETGGPSPMPTTQGGFGSRLLQELLPRDMNGTATLSHEPAGTRWSLVAPLAGPGRGATGSDPTCT